MDPDSYEGELRYRFDRWARQSVENRNASKRYKLHKQRALEMYIFPTFGNCDARSAEHFSKATIGAWVNKMLRTKVKREAKIKDVSPETLRGLHGPLSSVLKEAVIAEPPLRDRNPCDLTRLPTNDDWGISDDESSDAMEFSCRPRSTTHSGGGGRISSPRRRSASRRSSTAIQPSICAREAVACWTTTRRANRSSSRRDGESCTHSNMWRCTPPRYTDKNHLLDQQPKPPLRISGAVARFRRGDRGAEVSCSFGSEWRDGGLIPLKVIREARVDCLYCLE